MPDIFDTIDALSGDIFDQVASEPSTDIFDEVDAAPESPVAASQGSPAVLPHAGHQLDSSGLPAHRSGLVQSFAAKAAQEVLSAAAGVATVAEIPNVAQPLKGKPFRAEDQPQYDALKAEINDIRDANARIQEGGGGQPDPAEMAAFAKLQQLEAPPRSERLSGQLSSAAGQAFEFYGADPEAKNIAAQIGRGAGGMSALLPTALAGPIGLPAAAVQAASSAYSQAYDQAIKSGSDESAALEVASEQAVKTAPALAAYLVGGKLAGSVVARLLPEAAAPLAKAAAGTVGATVANVAVGSTLRAMEGDEWKPTVENLTTDALFGIMHGVGEYRGASQVARQRAAQEELRRKADAPPDSIERPAPATESEAPQAATEPAPSAAKGEILYPSDELNFRGGDPVSPNDVTRVSKVTNDKGQTVYAISYEQGGKRFRGYSDNPAWEFHDKFTDASKPEPAPPAPEAPRPQSPEPAIVEEAPKPEPTTPAPESPAPPEPVPPSPTGIRNAIVDEQRVKRGLPERMAPLRRSFGRIWDEAMGIVDKDPLAGSKLVKSIAENPRPLEDWESALLTHEQASRQNAFDQAVEDVNNATTEQARTEASSRLDDARNLVQEVYDVGQRVGTKSGQSLAARKLLVNDDFSLAKMEAVTRAVVNNGKPLSEKQAADVKALHEKIAATEAKLAVYERQEQSRQAQSAFENLLKSQAKEAAETAKTGKKITDFLDDQAAKAKARIIARRGRLNVTVDPLNVAGLVDEAIIGASYIAKGVTKFADWSTQMAKDFGERIKPYLDELFERSKQFHDTNASMFKAPRRDRKKPLGEQITENAQKAGVIDPKLVYDLAREKVNEGLSDIDSVMKAVHADLKPLHEGLTEREVRDAFSGYGKTKIPSKEADLVKLRELRRVGQLVSAIEDALKKEAPKKTGLQRDKPSQVIRDKMKELQKVMREQGIETTSPEQQLSTANQARATQLRNQIEDLDRQLKTGQKPAKSPSIPDTPEVERLRAERDAMKAKLYEIESEANPPKTPEEKANAAAVKQTEKAIAELNRKIKEGDISRAAKKERTPSPELERLRAERDAMRVHLDEMREAASPSRTPEQKALDAAMKAAQKSIARLDEMLKTGNLSPAAAASKTPLTAELEALRSERDAMTRAVSELRRESRPKTTEEDRAIKALEKSIAEYERRMNTLDLSPRPRRMGADTQRVATFKAIRDAAREAYQKLVDAQKAQRSPEEIALERSKKAIATRTAKLKERIAAGDYTKPPKKEPAMDKEKERLLFENQKAKEEYARGLFEANLAKRSLPKKAWDTIVETLNTSRALLTSFDLSAVLRQGGFIAFGHPVRALKSFPAMLKAFASERAQFAVQKEIESRPNASLYKQAKLFLSEQEPISLTRMEEQFASRWANKIPLVAGSQRAYTTFLNKLRADSFDAMASSLSRGSTPTLEEARAIANFVNVATGRGALPGKAATAASGLNTVFFAPRYVLSRFQLLAGQPFYGGNARTRLLVAKEYARYLAGVAVVYGLAAAAQDDNDPPINLDPTASDFLKIRFGDTRLDPMSGLIQATVFSAREGKELRKFFTQTKEKRPKYGSGGDVLFRFLRTKLSPAVGAAVNAVEGKNIVGEPVTPASTAREMVVPISYDDILKTMEEQGVPRGTALSLLSLFGMGLQTYEERKRK